jgi:hypothetical protein
MPATNIRFEAVNVNAAVFRQTSRLLTEAGRVEFATRLCLGSTAKKYQDDLKTALQQFVLSIGW